MYIVYVHVYTYIYIIILIELSNGEMLFGSCLVKWTGCDEENAQLRYPKMEVDVTMTII